MKVFNRSRILQSFVAGAILAISSTALASPVDQVLNGFTLGMTKEQAFARISSIGGDIGRVTCEPHKFEHREEDRCKVNKEFKLNRLMTHAVESVTMSFHNGKLDQVRIALLEPSVDVPNKNGFDRDLFDLQKKISGGMPPKSLKMDQLGIWKWDGGDKDIMLSARHPKDFYYPGTSYAAMSVTVMAHSYYETIKEPAKTEAPGLLDRFRDLIRG